MSTDDSVPSCRDGDAREYLEKHRIVELLNNMTSQLIFHRPGKCPTVPFTLYIAGRQYTSKYSHLSTSILVSE